MKIPVNCVQCNREFLKSNSEIKQMVKKGYKNHFCSNVCCREYNKIENHNKKLQREIKYYKDPKKCLYCGIVISYEKRHTNINYCSSICAGFHTQRDGGHCKWDDDGKAMLRELAKKNPYFNGTITETRFRNKNKIKKICPTCSVEFELYPSDTQICCSKLCSYKWIKKTGYLKGKSGGYRAKGGRGKQGWYKGYYCNSSWELAWVIYQLEHGIKFKRNTTGFPYEFNGKRFKFYPDFILENGDYVEVKGYTDEKVKAKFSNFPHKLIIIEKHNIKPFIQYTEEKYGNDFIKLYEQKQNSFST